MDRITTSSPRPAPPRDPRVTLERHRRDDSLDRVSRLTTRVAIGALAMVGALGLYVSRALPGHTTTPSTSAGTASPSTPTNPASAGSSGQASSQGSSAVSPPAAAPVQTQAPAQVSTGAS